MIAVDAREGAVERHVHLHGALSRAAGQQKQGGRRAAPVQGRHNGQLQVDRSLVGVFAVERHAQGSAARGNGGQMQRMFEPAFDRRQNADIFGGSGPRPPRARAHANPYERPERLPHATSHREIVWDSLAMLAHNLIDLRHDRHSRSRCDCERRGRPAVYFLLPHARLHPRHGPRLRGGTKSLRARCHRADSHQLAHVCRRPPADLPGHRHRGGVRQGGHGRDLGCETGSRGDDQ